MVPRDQSKLVSLGFGSRQNTANIVDIPDKMDDIFASQYSNTALDDQQQPKSRNCYEVRICFTL